MAFAVMKIGDSGEEVRTLKQLLRGAGYRVNNTDVYDEETSGVVSAYQRANGIEETGQPGASTWAKLASASVVSMPSGLTTKDSVSYLENNRPKAYQSDYTLEIDRLLDQVMNREAFSYDPSEDASYQRYKDRYMYLGKKAMNDAIGQAASLSGGFSNSYAESVGQQAYQDYLASFADAISQLQEMAMNSYNMESERLQNALGALKEAEADDYDKYLDDLAAYNDALDYYYKKLQDEQAQANWEYKNMGSGKKSSGSGGKTKVSPSVEIEKPMPNILTQSEFARRKAAGASSLKSYGSYSEYYQAMRKKYGAN